LAVIIPRERWLSGAGSASGDLAVARRKVRETAADQADPVWVEVCGRRMFVVGWTSGGACGTQAGSHRLASPAKLLDNSTGLMPIVTRHG